MLHRTTARIAAAVIALLGPGLLAAPASAATTARPVPSVLRELCAATHTSCAGHWTQIGGQSVYRLATHYALTGHGVVRPLATGCKPGSQSMYCTASNVGGGKCWSDDSLSGNGQPVFLNDCNPNSAGQTWSAFANTNGLGWTVANNDECLNDPNGTKSAGTQQQIWKCYVTTYEEYGYNRVGPNNSQYLLAVDGGNTGSSSAACLTDNGATYNGAPLLIASCNGSANQRWAWAGKILGAPASRPVPPAIRELCAATHTSCAGRWIRLGRAAVYQLNAPFSIDGRGAVRPLATGCHPVGSNYCTVSNVAGGKCWSDNSKTGNGVKVYLNNCDPDSAGQQWQAMSGVDGGGLSFEVHNAGQCLNDPYGSATPGTQQQIWNCYPTNNEDYAMYQVGPGNSQLLLGAGDTNPLLSVDPCLTDDGNTSSGAPLKIAACDGSGNQRWVYP